MDDKPLNPLAIVSLVAGVLALVGHCGCCIPILNYIVPFFVILLEIVGLVTGLVARSQSEEPDPLATAGAGVSAAAMVVSMLFFLLWMVMFGGVMALSILGN